MDPQLTSAEPVYVISVAARLAELPCWVLRVLDQEGIVVPVRTDSNRRLYSDRDLTLLSRVRYLMEERKVNIDGVKVVLELERAHEEERKRWQEREASLRSTGGGGSLVPLWNVASAAAASLPPHLPEKVAETSS